MVRQLPRHSALQSLRAVCLFAGLTVKTQGRSRRTWGAGQLRGMPQEACLWYGEGGGNALYRKWASSVQRAAFSTIWQASQWSRCCRSSRTTLETSLPSRYSQRSCIVSLQVMFVAASGPAVATDEHVSCQNGNGAPPPSNPLTRQEIPISAGRASRPKCYPAVGSLYRISACFRAADSAFHG